MAHHIRGIIGPKGRLSEITARGLPEEVRELDVGMGWVPMTEAMMEKLAVRHPNPIDADVRFERLGWGVLELLSELSEKSAILYLETEYFGRVGQQLATVFVDGVRTVEACSVDEGLRAIGVVARAEEDEWDTVGLNNFRHMPDE
jgi:hypothetical protein